MKNKFTDVSRRGVLQGAAVLGGAAALSGVSGLARAQSKGKIVVGTWGGDYARLLNKNIDAPILTAQGWEVVQDQAGDAQRRSKVLAERRLPRGTTDVQGLSAVNMYQMHDAGVMEELDYSKLKNAKNILESMKYPYGIGHIYSGMVGVYQPKLIEVPPTSYKGIFDPKWGDKLALIDIQYQYTMVAAALAAGGTVSDLEPGKALLLECKKAGMRIYPTNEAFAQALKVEEFAIGIMWKARVVQWQNADIPVKAITPTEGALAYVSGFAIPKNAPNKAGAYAYLDAMLEKSAQEAFAVDMGYNPTVTNAVVAPELNARIGFTPEEIKQLVNLDYGYITENDVALKEWWDKELKG
ncbi:MAG: extracellular solute-binding protein [Alphaproteobacteria bacterium]|nr:extracellular solute-binding protein [Alphaproteobacteria bacterium]MBU0797814.1 extracellular solute-binding protein [Alphaproteobacteria bacterium]MBU0888385.1 extracellular solute-binding protein [Alphaproteobacteria bacterium]MBU1814696.1 extracellular solute-binding protein [Alphaproteobacteria bacterium]